MAKRAKKTVAPSAAFEATRLLGRWTKLAQGHVLFGSGCSCGVGLANLRLQDFEPQILEFLHERHGDSGHATIPNLLRSIATQGSEKEIGGQLALLADLARSLDSFDELHRGRIS
jgi:hypothetical protein